MTLQKRRLTASAPPAVRGARLPLRNWLRSRPSLARARFPSSSEAAARPALNATPRLSGFQKSPCLPTSGRFSGRQASCREPFVLPKRNALVSVTSAGSRAGRRAAGGQRLGICAGAGNATVQRGRTRDRRVVVGSQGRQPINHDRGALGDHVRDRLMRPTREFHGEAAEVAAAPQEVCLSLVAAVDRYPDWCAEVI
jgi:hypothetical protein